MSWLWPIRTGGTFLDVWSLAHLGFWLFIGSTLWAFKLHDTAVFTWCLFAAIAWEVFERFAEPKWPTTWQSPESSINVFSDILMCALGVLLIWYMLDRKAA